MNPLDSPDLNEVLNEAKNLAIDCKHGFIHIDHILVAMLTTGCTTPKYLAPLSLEDCHSWLRNLYPASSNATDEDSLPLTSQTERIIWHATWFAHQNKDQGANSLHLLLAILSFDNQAAEKAKQAGVIFEDIAAAHYKQPFPRKGPEVKRRTFKKPTVLARFLRLAPSVDQFAEELYQHAQELWEFQQYDDCITVCQEGLGLISGFDKLEILLTQAYLKQKNYSLALPALLELVQLYPKALGFRFSLGSIHMNKGDQGKSQEIYRQLLLEYPDNTSVLNNIGFSLYKQGDYAAAVPYYEKAIQIAPSQAYPWNNLGFVKYKLGFTEEALQLIDKSLELDRGNSYAYMYKGTIFLEQGNKALAMDQFRQALRFRFTATYGNEVLELIKKCEALD